MNGYRSKMSYSDEQSEGYSARSLGITNVFIPSLAPPYPNIEGELKKDVAILKSSLNVRDKYIDDLRQTRDSLARQLDMREIIIECQEDRIKRYQELFSKAQKADCQKATYRKADYQKASYHW